MEDLVTYLLNANVIVIVFWLSFITLFRNSTFFSLNRMFLLAGIFLSFTIPLLPLPSPAGISAGYLYSISGERMVEEVSSASAKIADTQTWTNQLIGALPWLYICGAVLSIIRTVRGLSVVAGKLASTKIRALRQARVAAVSGDRSFSFFNILFVSSKQNEREVIIHEKAHIRQCHWFDLVVVEATSILFWFNPVIPFYRRTLKQQHEFLADEFALRQGVPLEEYLFAILHSCGHEKSHELIHQFNSNSIKKRIHMMTNNKTPYGMKLLYLSIIPLASLLLFSFGKKTSKEQSGGDGVTIVIDASHGGNDPGTSDGDLTEKALSLSVATMVAERCREKGMNVVLTRSTDEAISLEDRVAVSRKANADLFLSIHFSSDADPKVHGIACLVSKENPSYEKSLKVGSLILEHLKPQMAVNGVKSTGAMVLKKNASAAIILELGYLSNESDRAFITKNQNQQIIAEKIATAVASLSL